MTAPGFAPSARAIERATVPQRIGRRRERTAGGQAAQDRTMRRVGSGSRRSAAFAAVTRTLYRFGRSVNTRPLRRHTWKCTNEIYKYIHGSTKTRERGTGKGLGPLNGEIAVQRHLSGFRGCLSPRPTKPAPVPRIHRFPQKTNPAPPDPPLTLRARAGCEARPCGLLASPCSFYSVYVQVHCPQATAVRFRFVQQHEKRVLTVLASPVTPSENALHRRQGQPERPCHSPL